MIVNHISRIVKHYKEDNLHREFTELVKVPHKPEIVSINNQEVINFCSNDYLRLSVNENILQTMLEGVKQYGVGSGGTRNISGTTKAHVELEKKIATLHKMQSALVFSSAYNANVGALSALGKNIPNIAFFSDEQNHASIIHGINFSKAQKFIYKHSDFNHLEKLLKENTNFLPVIVCESIYSMSGTKTDLIKLSKIAQKYKALTYVDEVHAVGLYGNASGIAEEQGAYVDIINGTFGKAFGCVGGYIASTAEICEFIKSFASPFIFSTSLPPALCLACIAAIEEAKNPSLQKKFWGNVAYLKHTLQKYNINIFQTESHIISVPIPTVHKVKAVAKQLLNNYQFYVQPIFYPTVPIGEEMLRLTVSPHHTNEQIENLAKALVLLLK